MREETQHQSFWVVLVWDISGAPCGGSVITEVEWRSVVRFSLVDWVTDEHCRSLRGFWRCSGSNVPLGGFCGHWSGSRKFQVVPGSSRQFQVVPGSSRWPHWAWGVVSQFLSWDEELSSSHFHPASLTSSILRAEAAVSAECDTSARQTFHNLSF